MTISKKQLSLFLGVPLFVAIFLLSITENYSSDLWFHIKSGEIIAQMGIIHHDVFSFTASNREWFPYEWLFQVIVFYFKQLFGLESIKYLIATVVIVMMIILYTFLRRIFSLNKILALSLIFVFFVSIFEFITQRPQVFAYTFLIINLFLILWYFFKDKNLLWLSFPITLMWANLHGSIFLSVYLFLGYTFVSLINFYIFKQKSWSNKSKTLAIYTVITAVLTVLPPLGTLQYRLLWKFFENRWLITHFIDEWTPLSVSPALFIIYSLEAVVVLIAFIIVVLRQKKLKEIFWVIPLLVWLITPYTAYRNLVLAYLSLIITFGWSLSKIKFLSYENFRQQTTFVKTVLFTVLIFLIAIHIWILTLKRVSDPLLVYFPTKAVQFIKDYNLTGNMFNEYNFGGFLLYHLYPRKVYIDGRTDLYLCCELKDLVDLASKKRLQDQDFKNILDQLWNKNSISFILLHTEKHVVVRKIARILQDDPNWNLVFWDDVSQIFVKKDGKNDQIIKQFAVQAATPYNRDPFPAAKQDQALEEYQRMIQIADSARSRNAIGFILLPKGQFQEAKLQFEKAIALNPYFESPYMNLAELALKDGQIDAAINFYIKAQKLAPDRGLIYIRLGQLILQKEGDKEKVQKIWQEGIKNTVDEDAKNKLQSLINSIYSI